jgi:hypothetical protein
MNELFNNQRNRDHVGSVRLASRYSLPINRD